MKPFACWLLFFSVGTTIVAATCRAAETPTAKSVAAALARANGLFDRDDYSAAIKAYNDALRLDPSSVRAYIGRGTCYRMRDKYKRALADFDKALRLEPKSSEAHCGRAVVFSDKRDFVNAFAECEKALHCNPRNGAAYRTRGCVHSDNGESGMAIADYNRALRLDPRDGKALYDRAFEEATKGDNDRAIADLTEAIKITPSDHYSFLMRGTIYGRIAEWDKAIADLSQAIRLKPSDGNAFAVRAHGLAMQGNLDRASSDINEALRLDRQCAYAYNIRALIYEKRGEYTKGVADLTTAICIDPTDGESYCNRGVSYDESGDFAKARADFDKAIALKPKCPRTYLVRGTCYAKHGMADEAIADFTRAIQLEPEAANLYSARAASYEKTGEAQKAEEDFARARQLRLKSVLEHSGLKQAKASAAAITALQKRIQEEVRQLEYPDAVAEQLLAMVHDWNLAALAEKLTAAKDKERRGKLSREALSQAEREAATTLCQAIDAVVRYQKDVFELEDVIRTKTACCAGYAPMLVALGRAIGLDVQGLGVPITAGGPTADGQRHVACLLHFSNAQVAIVDAATPDGYISFPFKLAEAYCERGGYWEVKETRNLFKLHRRIRPLDQNGLIAETLSCRAARICDSGEPVRAKAIVAEAIRRDPGCSVLYWLRGRIHLHLCDYDSAIADFTAAIARDPSDAVAYLGRSQGYLAQNQSDRCLSDLNEAIRRNPKLAMAYASRAWARWHQAAESKGIAEGISIAPAASNEKFTREMAQVVVDCNEAIRLDPENAKYYKLRADVHQACGETDKVVDDLRAAIRLDSSNQSVSSHINPPVEKVLITERPSASRAFSSAAATASSQSQGFTASRPNSPMTSRATVTAVGLPPDATVRWVNTRVFQLSYDTHGVANAAVELWETRDGVKSWRSYGKDAKGQSPMLVTELDEGIYGFRMTVPTGPNTARRSPLPGDVPGIWIGVDLTRPSGRITMARQGVDHDTDKLLIAWEATDNQQLAAKPISLWYSKRPDGLWTMIAADLDNSGYYSWQLTTGLPQRIYLRLEVHDAAGNMGDYDTPEPVTVDALNPAQLHDPRPLGRLDTQPMDRVYAR